MQNTENVPQRIGVREGDQDKPSGITRTYPKIRTSPPLQEIYFCSDYQAAQILLQLKG